MIEKGMYCKLCTDVCYIGTIYILTTQVVVDLRKQFEEYVTGKAMPILSRARYVNGSKIERLFIYIFHLRTLKNYNLGI